MFQPPVDPPRAQVREQAQLLPDREKTRLRANLGIIPFVAADGAQENGIRLLSSLERRLRQWFAVPVDRDPAKVIFPKLQAEIALIGHQLQAFDCLSRDFRADSIAG